MEIKKGCNAANFVMIRPSNTMNYGKSVAIQAWMATLFMINLFPTSVGIVQYNKTGYNES